MQCSCSSVLCCFLNNPNSSQSSKSTLGSGWCPAERCGRSHVSAIQCSPWHAFSSWSVLGALGFLVKWTLNLGGTRTLGRRVKAFLGSGWCQAERCVVQYVVAVLCSLCYAFCRLATPGFVVFWTLILGRTLNLSITLTLDRAVKASWGWDWCQAEKCGVSHVVALCSPCHGFGSCTVHGLCGFLNLNPRRSFNPRQAVKQAWPQTGKRDVEGPILWHTSVLFGMHSVSAACFELWALWFYET